MSARAQHSRLVQVGEGGEGTDVKWGEPPPSLADGVSRRGEGSDWKRHPSPWHPS